MRMPAMDEDFGRRVHSILMEALELEGPERTAFLARACAGDARLRGRVDKLAAALTRSSGFLEQPAVKTRLGSALAGGATIPAEIHGYRILRLLGSGGMAAVYEAEQAYPQRRVAVKVMRNGLAETSAVHRFHFETQVLARLQHPGIAQIYEAGTFDDGHGRPTPFFAMEHVADATTLTGYIREKNLSLRERLQLFLEVCDAVQHGHQHGVIHRDLKPANILVDASGRPKVIDFGVARSSDDDQAWITRDSDFGSLVGTLHYMSPEQCTPNANIDVRADVYALGAVLYELVGGKVPHDLNRVPVPEALRIITQTTPRPLSALNPEARGDLTAIAAMALEKEPRRRYATVDALAADIRRHLNDEPIDARPATTIYQLRKFARRNRGVVAATGAVFLTLVAGIVSTSRMAIVAQEARRAAEAREEALEQVTAFQQSQLSQINVAAMGRQMHTALAEALSRSAQDGALDPAVADALAQVNFTTLAARMLDESILQRSQSAILTQFASQPLIRAALLQRLGATMVSLGLPGRAVEVADEAFSLRRSLLGADHLDTLESMHLRGVALAAIGRLNEATDAFRELLDRSTALLGPDHELTLTAATSLGDVLQKNGRLEEAAEVAQAGLERLQRTLGPDHHRTLLALNNIGIIFAEQGRTAEAEAAWREVLDRRGRMSGAPQGEYRSTLGNLGLILQQQGRLEEARPLLEENLALARQALGDNHPAALKAMMNLSSLMLEMGDAGAAEQLRRDSLEGRRRLYGPNHPVTLRAMGALAAALHEDGCHAEAEEMMRSALDMQRRQLEPDHTDIIESLAGLGAILRERGPAADAEAMSGEAVARARRSVPDDHWILAECLQEHGRALAAMGHWEEAEAELSEALRILHVVRGPDAQASHELGRVLAEVQAAAEAHRSATAGASVTRGGS
jgi:tetratricopeptide (TPR) repeat protein/tRNA A-37 threonylcarbamoyl transferase component Bud32